MNCPGKTCTKLNILYLALFILCACGSGEADDKAAADIAAEDVVNAEAPAAIEPVSLPNVSYAGAAADMEDAYKSSLTTDDADDADESPATHIDSVTALSLYRFDRESGDYTLCDRFDSAWLMGQDIVVLAPFASDEESIHAGANAGTLFMNAWNGCWYAADKENPCRIGFLISFDLIDGSSVREYLLKPGDELKYRAYLENYLYDDIHQTPGVFYSHLEPGQDNEDAIFSSIKFTAGKEISKISSDIAVTAFAYHPTDDSGTSPDFDDSGEYAGDRLCTVLLHNTDATP